MATAPWLGLVDTDSPTQKTHIRVISSILDGYPFHLTWKRGWKFEMDRWWMIAWRISLDQDDASSVPSHDLSPTFNHPLICSLFQLIYFLFISLKFYPFLTDYIVNFIIFIKINMKNMILVQFLYLKCAF